MPFRVRVEYQAQAVDGHRGWRGTETPGWRGESQPEGRRGCVRLGTTVRTGARVEGALTSGAGIGAICRPLTDWLQSRVEARTCGSGLHLVNDRAWNAASFEPGRSPRCGHSPVAGNSSGGSCGAHDRELHPGADSEPLSQQPRPTVDHVTASRKPHALP